MPGRLCGLRKGPRKIFARDGVKPQRVVPRRNGTTRVGRPTDCWPVPRSRRRSIRELQPARRRRLNIKRDLVWLLVLLTAASLQRATPPRANPHVSFVVQRLSANWEQVEITVDGRYDPPYVMAKIDSKDPKSVVRKLSRDDYLAILDQAEGDGLWHQHPPNSKGHWGCVAYPLSGRATSYVGWWDERTFLEHFAAHPAIQKVTAELGCNL